jgi:L-alanine-DL-glutamate epimerase-like enolase superfamily enzyme
MEADLLKGVDALSNTPSVTPDLLPMVDSLQIIPTARAAIMGAVINCLSGESGKLPWEVLGLEPPRAMRTSMTFALHDPAVTVEQVICSPYPIVKIKMGDSHDPDLLALLKHVRGKEIRVDANGGWSVAQAEEMIGRLARIGVKVIEQPTSPEYVADWPKLKGVHGQVALFMDEGMNTLSDFHRVSSYCDGINIKMAKSGGVLEAVRMAKAAKQAGKKVMLGCMVESSIGIAQSVCMGSLADFLDLDGPLLLNHDIADGLTYESHNIVVGPDIVGGPRLRQDVVQKQTSR